MKNSKIKGFTLIELIVVIAIIGILAAILIPSMIGYLRDSKISTANANAKLVNTAAASALTQAAVANVTPAGGFFPFTATDVAGGSATFEGQDLATYLGNSFVGVGGINYTSFAVNYALYCGDETQALTDAQLTAAQQAAAPSTDPIIGCYPLAS